MSSTPLNSSDASRDLSNSSLPSSPGVTIVQTPRAGTLIPNRIFVGGFPPGTAEHELRTFFEQFGDVKDVKIVRDCTGVCKGYGFITYETEEEAKNIQTKCGVLEFKGRQLNIGPAIRKASSLSRTIDIIPQGTVLCNNGMPLTFQNGLTVLASPDAYAVAQPTQANSMAYPVVVPQHVYVAPPLLCSQLQCLNAQQLQGISYAGQTPNNSQNNSTTQAQQSAVSASLPNSVNNIPITAIANLTISSSPVSASGQFRWASPAMPGAVATQYVCQSAAGYPNILQEIPAYDPAAAAAAAAAMGACYHEYPADIFGTAFDSPAERKERQRAAITRSVDVVDIRHRTSCGLSSLLTAAARNLHTGSPRKLGQCCMAPNIHANSPRYSAAHQRCGYKYISKPPQPNPAVNGIVKSGTGCEIDSAKSDAEQLAGNVVTPPPTPIS